VPVRPSSHSNGYQACRAGQRHAPRCLIRSHFGAGLPRPSLVAPAVATRRPLDGLAALSPGVSSIE
jgi:hypothetical protein